jgi:hypothetical protein
MEVIGVCGGRAKSPVGRMPAEARKKLEGIIETLREYL